MAGAKTVSFIREMVAWLVAGLFVYAGLRKGLRPDLFLVDIESYHLVPHHFAYIAAYGVPALEVVAGLALLYRPYRRAGAWVLLGLTVVFIIALGQAWGRRLDISCGCFGKAETVANYPWLIGRDMILALALGWLGGWRNELPAGGQEVGLSASTRFAAGAGTGR
jgi:putative oxidoreductase